MNRSDIETILTDGLSDPQVTMELDGNKLALDLVSQSFEGLNRVKRQQLVYGMLRDLIDSGELHAVTMRTRSPAEAAD